MEPLLITGLSDDANRTKRRLISYDDDSRRISCRPSWQSKTAVF